MFGNHASAPFAFWVSFVAVFVFSLTGTAAEPDRNADVGPNTGSEYVDNFLLEIEQFPKRAQFWVKQRTLVSDVNALNVAATVEKCYRVSSMPSTQVAGSIEHRAEGYSSQLGGSSTLRIFHFFGNVGERRYYQYSDRLPLPVNSQSYLDTTERVNPPFRYFNPIALAASHYADYIGGNVDQVRSDLARAEILKEWDSKDGKKVVLVCFEHGFCAAELIFSKVGPCHLERVKLYANPDRSDRPKGKIKADDVQSWSMFARTVTTWTEHKGVPVPERVVMFTKRFIYEEYDCEVNFNGWMFEKDVDGNLFEPDQFERTAGDVDYEQTAVEFDELMQNRNVRTSVSRSLTP